MVAVATMWALGDELELLNTDCIWESVEMKMLSSKLQTLIYALWWHHIHFEIHLEMYLTIYSLKIFA